MPDETPHDELQDERIGTLKDRLDTIEDDRKTENVAQRVSTIETSIKIGKWVVGVLVLAMVTRFVMQTDAGFTEIKDELKEVRKELSEYRTKQTDLAISLASEKANKPKSLKDLYEMFTEDEENLEWETEEELYDLLKKDLNEKDAIKRETMQQKQ